MTAPPRPPSSRGGRTTDPVVQGWATIKAMAGLVAAPIGIPLAGATAAWSTAASRERARDFARLVRAWHDGHPARSADLRTTRRPASGRYVITSDLHRCGPGPLDWPRRQGVVDLYADLIDRYASDGWTLIENGDVEDFWMVGGTREGAEYDATRIATALAGPLGNEARRDLYGRRLDRIVANYPTIYDRLRELAADGRYLRTAGNHDDVYADEVVVGHLARHLPGVDCVDAILLEDPLEPRPGLTAPGPVRAVITHGHHTDAWNGPGFSALGKAFTWLGTTLDDVPGIGTLEGPPSMGQLDSILEGRARNRLVTVDERFGGNLRFDSLNEELLFEVLGDLTETGPWMLFGHTHFPMLSPMSRTGRPWHRYANSGSGILRGAVTALEWDQGEVRLVVWRHAEGVSSADGSRPLRRTRLHTAGDSLRVEAE